MALIREYARPKVNLTLRVLGRRRDGYHELESLVVFADRPCDLVTLETDLPAGLETAGPTSAALAGENILDSTLWRLAAAEPRLRLGSVRLEKHLPVSAGLGGGSADAAALLRAVRLANPELAGAIDWPGIARSLGADVPVCLAGVATVMRGAGERLDPAAEIPALAAVLVNPRSPVPAGKTAQVFQRLGARPLIDGTAIAPFPDLEGCAALFAYLHSSPNDLEPAAISLMPEIAEVLAALARLPGIELVRMSGAGPTCFGLFASRELADEAASRLRVAQPGWWVEPAILS